MSLLSIDNSEITEIIELLYGDEQIILLNTNEDYFIDLTQQNVEIV